MNKRVSDGFSLVELMIAAAILGGLALAFNSIMKNMSKGNLKAQTDSEMLLSFNEMVAILSDPANCLASFGGKNAISDNTATKLKYKTADKFVINTPIGNNQIKILSYEISGYSASTNSTTLTVNFEKKKLLGGGASSKKINLYAEVDTSNNITACRSLASSTIDIWTRSTQTSSSIYYSGGNVGIGSTNPSAKLEVDGGIKPGPATTGSPCSPNPEGTFAYDQTNHTPVFCNSSLVWTPMGGGNSSWPSGSYCILRAGGSCPSGFIMKRAWIDVGTHGHQMCSEPPLAGDMVVNNWSGYYNHCRLTWNYCCK